MDGFYKMRRIHIVLFIQTMIIIYVLGILLVHYKDIRDLKTPLVDWKSKYITFNDGWYIDENIIQTDKTIDMIYGPYIELKKGTYTIKVDYECDVDQECLVYADSQNDKYIKTQLKSLKKNRMSTSYDFES